MFDIIDGGGKDAFVRRDNSAGHVVGRQARIAPDDRDDGNADIGKDIGRGPNGRQHAKDHDKNRHHDEGVGTREG